MAQTLPGKYLKMKKFKKERGRPSWHLTLKKFEISIDLIGKAWHWRVDRQALLRDPLVAKGTADTAMDAFADSMAAVKKG